MTGFDVIVLAIVALSTLLAFVRGVVRELIALAAWIVGFVAAITYAGARRADAVGPARNTGRAARARVRARSHRRAGRGRADRVDAASAVHAIGLGFVDRFLGGVFGVARGVLAVMAFVLIAGLTTLPKQDWWQNSLLGPPLAEAALALRPYLPAAWARAARLLGAGGTSACPVRRPPHGRRTEKLHHVRNRRRRRAHAGQPAALRRRCCCCSTAARTPPASSPAKARCSTCTRAAASCATSSARATCASCRATSASAIAAIRPPARRASELESQPFYVNSPFGITLGAQRQPDQQRGAEARALPARLPPRQHQFRLRGAAERAGARARARRAPRAPRRRTRSSPRSPACTSAAAARTRSSR